MGVVGLSAGHSAATTIALEGICGELRLADFDDVELSNLNRLPATVLDCGVNKAVVAARRIAEIDPYLPVRIVPEGLHAGNVEEFVAGLDVLVEECDDIAMKALVREVARHHGVPVVMDTSDRGLLDVERFDQEPERPIFHGLLSGVTAGEMGALSTLEKIPHVLRLVDPARASARGAASLAEIGQTLSTWPQLASDVTLGGASVATTVRRLGTGEPVPSGRVRVDVEALLEAMETPELPTEGDWPDPIPPPPPEDPVGAVVHAATRAPSGGNAQPWRFELAGDVLSFELDRSKTSFMDVRWRGSYVALGAALFNARVAASALGRAGAGRALPRGTGLRCRGPADAGGRVGPRADRALPRRPRPVRQPPEGRAGSGRHLGRGPPGRGDPHRGRAAAPGDRPRPAAGVRRDPGRHRAHPLPRLPPPPRDGR